MEQNHSLEARSHSYSKEIIRVSWNPKVHYRIHNSPPLVPIPSLLNPLHTFKLSFSEVHFNIILSTQRPKAFSSPQLLGLVSYKCFKCQSTQNNILLK